MAKAHDGIKRALDQAKEKLDKRNNKSSTNPSPSASTNRPGNFMAQHCSRPGNFILANGKRSTSTPKYHLPGNTIKPANSAMTNEPNDSLGITL
jgi:hypothetical protein